MKPKKNRYIASFDTEDDGKGNPYLWAIVHDKGAWHTNSRTKAIEYILTLARDLNVSNTQLELWATNLEYDLVNLFGPERLKELHLSFGKAYLVGAAWPGHNTIFKDTVRHIPLGVAKLGELVGLKKLEMKEGTEGNEAYCIRDTTITRRTAVWLSDLYESFGIQPKQTLASSALTIWREKYWKREVRLPSREIVAFAKQCYYGGRTEAFAKGVWENVSVLDAASMFPWAMRTASFPLPWGAYKHLTIRRENHDWDRNGLYRVLVHSQVGFPFLPVRTDRGTIYPNGTFESMFTGEELIYARECGVKLTMLEGYEFKEECEPFKGYVDSFFALKNKARGPARMGYKLLLNSLYGKFGETGDRVTAVPLSKFVTLPNPPKDFRVWYGIAIYSEKKSPPPWGNQVWSALITARARVRLAKEMAKVRAAGGTVLYCDTDSVIYQNAPSLRYAEKASKAGDFELRGRYARILIAGKKEYGLCDDEGRWEIAVKGVPEIARKDYLFTGHAEFQKPNRIKEAARRGLKPNIWTNKTKDRKVNFDKRTERADGTFEPLIYSPNGKGQDNG